MTASAIQRAWWSDSIATLLASSPLPIIGALTQASGFDVSHPQVLAWKAEIALLQGALARHHGRMYLEFVVPRMGTRIDALVIIGPVLFVIEFKVGTKHFVAPDVEQVVDYALDLHHFHEGSHKVFIAPILVATDAPEDQCAVATHVTDDKLLAPSKTNAALLEDTLARLLALANAPPIDVDAWENSAYKPTPTIIEATLALYREHSVAEITRSDAGAQNLAVTAQTLARIIEGAKDRSEKVVCFVTGVPGAGKTLVGLDTATRHLSAKDELYSVFLSGNGPLVAVLREALTRDRVARAKSTAKPIRKGVAANEVKAFIQNVHHFRDDCLKDPKPPAEHVALFDEAQRAWTLEQTADFMKRKKGRADFAMSEPEFLISCMDRHRDWAAIVCLVGGGQEINTGEAGIGEWIASLERSFPRWKIFLSDQLTDSEYGAGSVVKKLRRDARVTFETGLHLATSLRSFRSEKVSRLVKDVLDVEMDSARETLAQVLRSFPIVLTRDTDDARRWLRSKARGSERYGIVVSSQAERLKPHAIDVKTPVDPVHWFLAARDDVRSSFYLEDVATEFHVQGLELDWACVVWDADFRRDKDAWEHWSFRGNRWQRIHAAHRQRYQKNAYRVLLTRARQGMVIVVPRGDREDPTRSPAFYDGTYEYLRDLGIPTLPTHGAAA